MNEELNPEVAQNTENPQDVATNYADMTLGELSQMFEGLMADEERMKRAKEAENIKTAFYKKLTKEKAEVKPADTAEEAEAFFGSDSKRTAKPTQWAVQQLAFSDTEQDGSCWWWLRSPGAKADMAACVCGGKVNTEGYKVDYNSNSVRPVIKFNINLYKQIKSEAFKERVKQANQQTQENQEENNNNF